MNGSSAAHLTHSAEGPPDAIVMPEKVMTKTDQRIAGLEMAQRLIEAGSAIDAYVLLRQMREIIEVAEKQLIDPVMEKCIGQTQDAGGALVQARRKPRKWDYHGDSVLANLNRDLELTKEQIKAEEKMLQALTTEQADTETGEVRKPATPLPDEWTVAVSFPKGGAE